MKELPYNKYDPYSIEEHAKLLEDHCLRDVLLEIESLETVSKRKGSLGQIIEEYYFLYKPNSIAGPDFPEAGVELKTTPVLVDKVNKYKAKERLVFNIINYEKEHENTFIESSFWKKNKLLLLMFYLHEKNSLDIDLIFKLIRLFRFPAVDLKIIKDDWEIIKSKIKLGQAHEISEGDTFYLGACTKGVNRNSTRKQPFSDIPAKQRAYSLKPKYLNAIIAKTIAGDELIDQTEEYQKVLGSFVVADPLAKYSKIDKNGQLSPIVRSVDEFEPGETIEELIIRKFKPYYGYTEEELFEKLSIPQSKAKSRYYNLAKAILNVSGEKIEEFEKADIQLKTIRLENNGRMREHMSFPQIQFREIVEEEWEDSDLFNTLSTKFFFVIFRKDLKGREVLKKVMFWNMPISDIEKMHQIWVDTRDKIEQGDFDHFIKISDNKIGHIRPKGADSTDLMLTHLGTSEKKKSFWLNKNYILSIIGTVAP